MAAPSTSGIPNSKITIGADTPNRTINLRDFFADAETASSDLTFTIEGGIPSLFTSATIDSSTGVLTLDYNDNSTGTANLTIRAKDAENATVDTIFTVEAIAAATGGNETLTGGTGVDYLDGAAGNDSISGLNLDDTLKGGIGDDSLIGGTGNDEYLVDAVGDVVTENSLEGTDTVRSEVTPYTLGNNVENLILEGAAANGKGNALDNTITGNSASNGINGFAGSDTMKGGAGNDNYAVDNTGDLVTENATEGTDGVQSSIDYTLGTHVENLTLTGTAARGTGNTVGNNITGNEYSNILSGGTGNDTMTGVAGNDTYVVDVAGDVVTELSEYVSGNTTLPGGTDTVQSSISYTDARPLEANVENLIITGNAVSGTGNDLNNSITGNTVGNILDGGAGDDIVTGGAGNDTYIIDAAGDQISETSTSSSEIDTVKSSISSDTTTLGANLENLELTDSAVNGTGNSLDNKITGNDGNNQLRGDQGNDTLRGGLGNDSMNGETGSDTYYVAQTGDVVTESSDQGIDTVESSIIDYTLTNNVEKLTLAVASAAVKGTGNGSNNTILGNGAHNEIDGAVGKDTMTGGKGNDTYFVNDPGDLVTEAADVIVNNVITSTDGTDTVKSLISYTLGSNVEKLELTGTSDINGTGNTVANDLKGNAGINTLTGGTGNDTMAGGAGDDTYVVDASLDVVNEALNEGTDTIQSNITETLDDNVENLELKGINAIDGKGNDLANTITGNSAANKIDGLAGVDNMIGGAGNDTYVVDDALDVVNETSTVAAETDKVESGVAYELGTNVEQLTLTGLNAINGKGNNLNNAITGNSAANKLDGSTGSDTMNGAAGNDIYVVDATGDVVTENTGAGTDKVQSSIAYTLGANLENLELTLKGNTLDAQGKDNINGTGNILPNTITGNAGNNILSGGAGTDTLNGDGADTLSGGDGDDTYIIYSAGTANTPAVDTITEAATANAGTDTVSSSITYSLGSNLENLTLTGSAAINGTGNGSANTITGNTAANTLDGGLNNDTMIGGTGNDFYKVNTGGDVVTETSNVVSEIDKVESAVSYTLGANLENLTITGGVNATGNALNNTIVGNDQGNTIDGGTGSDAMTGGAGNDTYTVDATGDLVTEVLNEGSDKVKSSVTFTLGANVENLELTLKGNTPTLADNINGTGNDLPNTITGNAGNNIILGGGATDILKGEAGDDTYFADLTNDAITEDPNEGTDTVSSSATYILLDNLEHLILTGTTIVDSINNLGINGTGNASDNKITGNAVANTLDGGVGKDSMTGGTGNDTYKVDDLLDVVTETSALATEIDKVESSVNFTLGANVEELTLIAGSAATDATGNALNNKITGNVLNNNIDGKVGSDIMTGNGGDDTYTVDATGDVVKENTGGGNDTVQSSVTYTLSLFDANNVDVSPEVENLTLTGTAAINGTGNSLPNNIMGNDANNLIDGKVGSDTMTGKKGNDTYTVDATGDVVTEVLNEGTDTVQSSANYDLGANGANVENLTLTGAIGHTGTGNDLANIIIGTSNTIVNGFPSTTTANDTLIGGAGNDTMIGGTGNDTYTVDATLDVVTETSTLATETDTVKSSATYTLSANVENLELTGSGNINGTGNTLNNTIKGNDGINILSGGTGNDAMTGGAADDTYVVDATGDVVTELAGGGTDEVQSSVTEILDAEVEKLTLTGTSAINGTGNTLANTITGNSAANTLSGGAVPGIGGDTMTGGLGDDIYVVDATGDSVTESGSQGTDKVESSINYTLVTNVEKLTLTGTAAINGTGNILNNTILGNTGKNRLSGLEGNDSMTGGKDDDTYVVDATGDLVTEVLNEGSDKVESDVTYTLGANVENLTLTGTTVDANTNLGINGTGNALANTIIGNTVANTLNGSTGNDTMTGGTGNDIYVVDATGDVITELASGGTDEEQSSVTETLDAQVENLTLTGTNAINGTGNDLPNAIKGNTGANTLIGLDGNDSMTGGAGNDIYVVNATGDEVTELAAGGTDIVESSVTETLDPEVENLTLIGATANSGTGNALANTIKGNSAANTLSGLAGNDTMIGGTGNDIYVVDATGDVVTEAVDTTDPDGNVISAGTDLVQSSVTETLDANVENLTLTGLGDINGTGNGLDNTITGNAGKNTLSGGAGVDVLNGAGGDDTYIVDSTTDTITDSAGTADLVSSSVSYTLGAGLDNLTLTGTSLINGTGNGDSNILLGNSAGNSLSAGASNDTLTGGAGNDTLTGGAGSDKFIYDTNAVFTSSGLGIDRITDFVSGTDKIVLDQTTFTALTALATQFAVVGTDAVASTSDALIVYSTDSDNLFYNQNGSAAGYGTGAQFANLAEIAATDFELQA
jgi:trimeric autotransporter adhesin